MKTFQTIAIICLSFVILILVIVTFARDKWQEKLSSDLKEKIESIHPPEIIKPPPWQEVYAETLKVKMNYRDASVRNFALNCIKPAHEGSYNICQIVDIYYKIYENWKYVNDPNDNQPNYYAAASETIQTLAGDCDDFTILMVSLIKAIGGEARAMQCPGHIYPEVFIGYNSSDYEMKTYLKSINECRNFWEHLFKTNEIPEIYYSTDPDGKTWLNLDYTSQHPGGEYMKGCLANNMFFADGRWKEINTDDQ